MGYQSGVFKNATTALGFTFPLTSGYKWWNGVDVTSSQYLLYSDLNSVGQATVSNSRPTAWTTPDLTDQSLLNLINTLPERVGLPGFTSISAALQWLQNTGTYFLIKTGYENIVTSNLQLNYDAGWYNSYNGSGTAVYDISGNNRTGTLVNGTGFNSSGVGSFVFDGTDDDIRVSVFSFARTNVTLTGWFYVKLGTVGVYLNNGDDPGGYCIGIGQYFSKPNNEIVAGSGTTMFGSLVLVPYWKFTLLMSSVARSPSMSSVKTTEPRMIGSLCTPVFAVAEL